MSIDAAVTSAFMAKRKEPITKIVHDVYPSIDPAAGLKDSALGLRVLALGRGTEVVVVTGAITVESDVAGVFDAAGDVDGSQERIAPFMNRPTSGGVHSKPMLSGYSCSKVAVNKLVEYIHTEYPENVRVFAMHPGAIPTALSFGALKENARQGLVDTVELAAGAILWLATQPKADFLRGKYFSANWDVDEVVAHEDKITANDLLLTTVVGGATPWV
ncbi:hypothetical protein RQP46_010856 [Phenoliferia psychrophenolica]